MSKQVLGRGLGALIPGNTKKDDADKTYQKIPLENIAPNPMQPRREFNEESLQSLAQSLKINGLMQPLVVRPDGSGFTIIAGERRYRAAKLAGMNEVPAVLMDEITDGRMLELALVENLQREDLNPMDMAEAYERLVKECTLTQNQLSEKVGKSRAAVANTLRLNNLPVTIKKFIRESKLSEGHARAIMQLDGETEMLLLADKIITGEISVRQTEEITRKKKRRRLIPKMKLPALVEIENYLKRLFGTSVKINPGLKRGKVEIEYYSDEDLERILELFRKIDS